jgi:hypothetical protein
MASLVVLLFWGLGSQRVMNAENKSADAPVDAGLWASRGSPPTHGCAETREAAMAAFAKSWRRE